MRASFSASFAHDVYELVGFLDLVLVYEAPTCEIRQHFHSSAHTRNKITFSFFSTPGNVFIVALKQKLITINKMVLHFKISFISHFMLHTREKMASSGKTHLNLRLDGCWKRKTMQLLKFCFVPFIFFVKCEYIGW